MRRVFFMLLSICPLVFAAGCKSDDDSCSGPGDCPAGSICSAGTCEAVITPTPDASARSDVNMSVYDAGPRHDSGPAREDSGNISLPDLGPLPADAGNSGPPVEDAGELTDVSLPALDILMPDVLTLGDPCLVPNLENGEIDDCSIDDPNLYCLASIDGQTAYCSRGCFGGHDPGHHGEDGGGEHGDAECGAGCCMLKDPGQDAGSPGEIADYICRFAPDCN
jgi:hypothetical protein